MTLEKLGEDELLRRILPRLSSNSEVIARAGDDCAITRRPAKGALLVLKTDCVVEGIHFTSKISPRDVGWKAMARPLSDFAAMSATPQFAMVTLIAPARTKAEWITSLYRGLNKCARRFGVAIVGGETSNTRGPISISVSVTGQVEKGRAVLRSGGKSGDTLWVTGKLGGSLSGRHLRFVPRIEESRWLTERFDVHAMMDLSDGLGADLPRLAAASDAGFEINEAAIPRQRGCTAAHAIRDGEDYELLFAIASGEGERLMREWKKKWRLELTRIGTLTKCDASSGIASGYVHFKKRA